MNGRELPLSVTVARGPGEPVEACHARALHALGEHCRRRDPGLRLTAVAVARLDHDALTLTALASHDHA